MSNRGDHLLMISLVFCVGIQLFMFPRGPRQLKRSQVKYITRQAPQNKSLLSPRERDRVCGISFGSLDHSFPGLWFLFPATYSILLRWWICCGFTCWEAEDRRTSCCSCLVQKWNNRFLGSLAPCQFQFGNLTSRLRPRPLHHHHPVIAPGPTTSAWLRNY